MNPWLACRTTGYVGDIDISIYLLTAIGLSPGGSSTVHIYTQTIQVFLTWLQKPDLSTDILNYYFYILAPFQTWIILPSTANGIPSCILTHMLHIIYKSSQGPEDGHKPTETCRSIQV